MSQFFYVHPDNPQGRLMKQAAEIIHQGGVIVYPTDSGYALGCHIGDKKALDKICRIRDINKEHNFTLVCKDLSELSEYARVDNTAFRLLKNNTPGPYTFIFKASKEVPKRLMNPKKRTIGIRVPNSAIVQELLSALEEPIMSTSLIMPGNSMAEFDPEEIRDKLEHQVDLIIHGGHLGEHPTTVVDFSEGDGQIIRVGEGDPTPFE
ncbi:L-threonylcarbamoyladenylate synthase [Thalassotalea sp. 1_MG-2023]|uniref:L-threonylcarbamoyladenylate synthase n=1 Tax=Thalassotalea sp. 1_MG-2023 TaxID=3062680 RepID=UPI0026E130CF|nr:L-threonylcarbamoyladenylate synthase [Thalassotalea sp. 1_MG-2023]MDO6427299.1 L-threonylcarbamoyladenylate synthase [Thalassotalea sp. 1_MG-2023]